MKRHFNKKAILRAIAATAVGVGIIAAAYPVGTQMEKVPHFDRIGFLIKILE